jgi:hypothetical protein
VREANPAPLANASVVNKGFAFTGFVSITVGTAPFIKTKVFHASTPNSVAARTLPPVASSIWRAV